MQRRHFLKWAAGAGVTAWTVSASAWAQGVAGGAGGAGGFGNLLVLVELKGANDGLNTVVPFADPLYTSLRPRIAIKREEVVQLHERAGLHPAMAPLLPLWQSRRLAFALGVGWPEPNRSHFKAADQWDTASPSGDGPGWIAAAFDQRRTGGPLVALGPSGCPAMEDIAARIVAAFDAAGLRAEVDTVFRPAWSTDWITPEGRAKLVAYGIAAPHPVTTAPAGDAGTLFVRPAVGCPRCASRQTTLVSEFGSTACKALYRCRRCDEPFDYFKEL